MLRATVGKAAHETILSADPYASFAVFSKGPNLYVAVRKRRDAQRNWKKFCPSICGIKFKQSRIRAGPDVTSKVFKEYVHTVCGWAFSHSIWLEAGVGLIWQAGPGFAVSDQGPHLKDTTTICSDPVRALTRLDQIACGRN